MKYIRTEENIYKLQHISETIYRIDGKDYSITTVYQLEGLGAVLAQEINQQKAAETIEELCDGFVMYDEQFADDESFTHIVFASLEEAKKNMKYQTNKAIIYGAIWTKGRHGEPILTSVAKMNEKGELELL